MTYLHKIVNIVIFTIVFGYSMVGTGELYAQLKPEQKQQIKQYDDLVREYAKKSEFKIAAYYSNKRSTVYLKEGFYAKAIESYNESVLLNEKINNYAQIRKIYLNMAFIYSEMNQLKNTQKYFDNALKISRRFNNRSDICVDIMNGTNIMILKKQYSKALSELEEALKIGNALNDARLLRECYRQMALCYNGYGNKKKSDEYYDYFKVYDRHVKERGVISREKKTEEIITEEKKKTDELLTEKKARELELSLLEERRKRAEDSLNTALTIAELTKKQIEQEKEKAKKEKEKQELLTQSQENQVKAEKAEKARYQTYLVAAMAGGFLLLLGIIGIIFALNQKRKANKLLEQQNLEIAKAKDEIENKSNELQDAIGHIQIQNKNILQSINYAQRIQDAMLPKQLGMKTLIPESFIYFKPRDVVSGDFYWFSELDRLPRNGRPHPEIEDTGDFRRIFISAVDCTGHGVPGAFMSMLGFNLLNDIVRRGTIESHNILSSLHKGIRKSLNQEETQNRDGMDMALCVIDPINKVMEFSGAQNPLIYMQEGKVHRLRGNKYPVGGYQMEEHSFTKHVIDISKPTTCYIFSDGFPDQFGGQNGRKFMAKNFRELLFEIYQMPMEEQEKILDLVINEWMGNHEQTDDILVMGFKIDLNENLLLSVK